MVHLFYIQKDDFKLEYHTLLRHNIILYRMAYCYGNWMQSVLIVQKNAVRIVQ